MNKIKVMPTSLANKIAAGEVIENLASVIKELVENSIDAQARKIDINLIDSGMQLMQVVDNGIGMSKDDLALAIQEHASSKLVNEYDLFNIWTLGFRGEALASINAVSHLQIASNDGTGDGYVLANQQLTKGYASQGAKVVVNNIFYNVPARLKHLKSQNTELSNIVEIVHKLALGYPQIAFSLTNDEKTLLKTNGRGDMLAVIHEVYGLDIAKNMEPIVFANNDFKVSGYLSNNQVTKGNKKAINIYVNNRLINNSELASSIIEGYDDYLMERRFPIVVLNISCDSQLIDVNVHPAKREVRLSNQKDLISLITHGIKEHFRIKVAKSKVFEKQPSQETLTFEGYQPTQVSPARIAEPSLVKQTYQAESQKDYESFKEEMALAPMVETIIDTATSTTENAIVKVPEHYLELDVIGQFSATYIIAQSQKGLHLIDQHAAMERINYEQMIQAFEEAQVNKQELLVPVVMHLTLEEKMKLAEHKSMLNQLNLHYEEQANHDVLFRSIPMWIKSQQVQEVIENIINYLIDNKAVSKTSINKEQIILAACKTSLKANHVLTLPQQKHLVDCLMKTSNYDRCPHGRPIILTYTPYEIDKMFKRIV